MGRVKAEDFVGSVFPTKGRGVLKVISVLPRVRGKFPNFLFSFLPQVENISATLPANNSLDKNE